MRTSIYYFSLIASTICQPLLPESTFNVVCPESEDGYSVYIPHPTDCGLYYQCVGTHPSLLSCPDGLYFDTNLNVCNWPQFVDCQNKETDNPETTTHIIMTTTEDLSLNVTFTTIIAENETTTTGVNGTFMRSHNFDVVCPESEDGYSVYVPHPTDCSLYYQCVGKNPSLMSCPDGLYFDSILNVCNWICGMSKQNRQSWDYNWRSEGNINNIQLRESNYFHQKLLEPKIQLCPCSIILNL